MGPLDFDSAIQLALTQSRYFRQSAMEIDISLLNQSDSKHSMAPSLKVDTTYYLTTPDRENDDEPRRWGLSFNTGSYNPLISYFSYQASKLLTEAAIAQHLMVIDEGFHQLAGIFLELEALFHLEACQRDLAEMARKKWRFFNKKRAAGTASALEVRIAAQEAAIAAGEIKANHASQRALLNSLSEFLGLEPRCRPLLNLNAARNQILGRYDPNQACFDDARLNSFDLKIQQIKERLQAKNITKAYAKFMPSFSFGLRTPDPISEPGTTDNMYFSVNMSLPIWENKKRLNDISRQKVVLRQYKNETVRVDRELEIQWRQAKIDLETTASKLELVQSAEELANLKRQQAQLSYQSGGQPFSALMDAGQKHIEAKRNTILAVKEYDLAVLKIRQLSGNLFLTYVDVAEWEVN